jgi:hypothetical protein
LFFGTDSPENKAQSLAVPEPDAEEAAEVNKEPVKEQPLETKVAEEPPAISEDISDVESEHEA